MENSIPTRGRSGSFLLDSLLTLLKKCHQSPHTFIHKTACSFASQPQILFSAETLVILSPCPSLIPPSLIKAGFHLGDSLKTLGILIFLYMNLSIYNIMSRCAASFFNMELVGFVQNVICDMGLPVRRVL